MKVKSDRFRLRSAILGSCSVLAMIPFIAAAPFLSIPPVTNLALGMLAAGCTALILTSVLRLREGHEKFARQQRQLEHEADALNNHAIVSMADSNRHFCYVNQKFTEATGYTSEDVIGKAPVDLYHEHDDSLFALIIDKLRKGEVWVGETRLRCKDGHIMYSQTTIMPRVDEKGVLLGTVAVRTDITEMRRAAAEVDTVAALRRLTEPVVVFMPKTLDLAYMNKAATDAVGWAEDGYIGKTVADIPLDIDLGLLRHKLIELSKSETEQVVIQLERWGKTFDASIQLITLQSGEHRYFAIFRDVSGALQLAKARQEFIATVSHELRTPLTAIKGAMGLLLSGATGVLPPKSQNFVEIAQRNADRLVLIVNDILDLEKIVAGKMEFRRDTVDLAEVLLEARMANQSYAEQYGVTVRVEGVDEPALAKLDTTRILQVLANLLSNACKFSKPNSEIVLALVPDGHNFKVSVTDSGIGIPDADISRMFERFQQASNADRNKRGGSGLGLSIVKVIVEKHGGTVSLTSKEGVGTTVTFTLPSAVDLNWPQSLHVVAG